MRPAHVMGRNLIYTKLLAPMLASPKNIFARALELVQQGKNLLCDAPRLNTLHSCKKCDMATDACYPRGRNWYQRLSDTYGSSLANQWCLELISKARCNQQMKTLKVFARTHTHIINICTWTHLHTHTY